MSVQTELHRHLDVSTRLSTLLELAQERGLEGLSTSLEAFREKLVIRQPLSDLHEVLAQFSLFQKVLDRPEVLERIAFEVVEDCFLEGTRRVELRYSPNFVAEYSKLAWTDILLGFESGIARALKKYPEMKAGMLCIATRDFGPDEVNRSVEFFLAQQSRFAGLDLAGNEDGFPCRLFESSFQAAIGSQARITVHSGEASGSENIWEAIELLGAQRIGHGIRCVEDPQLMKMLAEKRICLEMCPTSNWLTRGVKSLEAHPLPQVLRAGIPVCVNTDDPAIFGTTLPQELALCMQKMGLTQAELDLCQSHAFGASFLA